MLDNTIYESVAYGNVIKIIVIVIIVLGTWEPYIQ